jgi:hypothetical protein
MSPYIVLLHSIALLFLVLFILIPKALIIDLYGLRVEDIFGVMAIVYCFFMRTKWHARPVFLSYLMYLLYVGLHALISSSFLFPSLVILAKYLSYLCFFYLFSEVTAQVQWPKISEKVITVTLIYPVLFGIYQVLSLKFFGLYGVSFPGHEDSPLSGAAMYFFCALLTDILLNRKWGFLHLTFLVLALLGGSKTIFLVVLIYIGFTAKVKIFIPFILSASAIYFGVIKMAPDSHQLHRYNGFLDPLNTLIDRGIWHKLPNFSAEPLTLIFGRGIDYGHIYDGNFYYGMAMDNLFLYLISKDGVIGAFLFVCFVCSIVYSTKSFKRQDKHTVYALLLGLLVGGLGAETFFLSVPALILWICLGILSGKTIRENLQKS